MRILLVGGTGIISTAVAEKAITDGIEVYTISRGSEWRKIFTVEGTHPLYVDIKNADRCRELLKDQFFDVVVDFISYTPDNLRNKLEILEGKFKQYIFISSAGAYELSDNNKNIKESQVRIGYNGEPYGWNKCLCESYLREYFRMREGIYYTIVRPGFTYSKSCLPYWLTVGFTFRSWLMIERILEGRSIPVIGKGDDICTVTHADDVAAWIKGLFLNQKAMNEDFHITADAVTTWEEILGILEDVTEKKIERKQFTKEEIIAALPENKEQAIYAVQGVTFDNSKIKEVVSEDFFTTERDGIAEAVDFYMQNRDYILSLAEIKQERVGWETRIDALCQGGKHCCG